MSKFETVFYFTIILLLFHITRNISTIVYVGLLLSSYAGMFVLYLFRKEHAKVYKSVESKLLDIVFLVSLLWIPVISLMHMGISEYFTALSRYLVTVVFIIFCFIYRDYQYPFILKVLRALCVFMAIASLTIPYQIIFGKINFFAEPSLREGLIRYSSLAGSLTALGTLGSFSLAILLFSGELLFSKKIKGLLIILTVMGMLMSLQKAAVANIIICFAAYVLINGKISFVKRILTVFGFFLLAFGVYAIFGGAPISLYIEKVIKYTFSGTSLGVKQDLLSRIWDLPKEVVKYHGIGVFDLLFGIGFPALSGILGLSHLPMSHNNYFDLVFSGGVVHFSSFIALICSVSLKVIKKKNKYSKINEIDRSYMLVSILVLANMIIGAASFYHPITSIFIIWMICSYDRATIQCEEAQACK